jgi:uncharacterized membrane protein YidH (DUF202 family)
VSRRIVVCGNPSQTPTRVVGAAHSMELFFLLLHVFLCANAKNREFDSKTTHTNANNNKKKNSSFFINFVLIVFSLLLLLLFGAHAQAGKKVERTLSA